MNIPSRVAGFINSFFDGCLNDDTNIKEGLLYSCLYRREEIEKAYEARRYSEAIKLILDVRIHQCVCRR